jgi:hypothetical protein
MFLLIDEIVENGVGHYLAVVEPEPWAFPDSCGFVNFFFNEGKPFWDMGSKWAYDKVLGAKEIIM